MVDTTGADAEDKGRGNMEAGEKEAVDDATLAVATAVRSADKHPDILKTIKTHRS